MRRRTQTTDGPLLHVMRPGFREWRWRMSLDINSSGYVTRIGCTATHPDPAGSMVGGAEALVELGDDLPHVMEMLAVEACLAACEDTLPGHEKPVRRLSRPF